MQDELLEKILRLLDLFVKNKLSSKKYQVEYMKIWNNVRDSKKKYGTEVHNLLDELFSDCDMYSSNPELRGSAYIPKREFKSNARKKLISLKALVR